MSATPAKARGSRPSANTPTATAITVKRQAGSDPGTAAAINPAATIRTAPSPIARPVGITIGSGVAGRADPRADFISTSHDSQASSRRGRPSTAVGVKNPRAPVHRVLDAKTTRPPRFLTISRRTTNDPPPSTPQRGQGVTERVEKGLSVPSRTNPCQLQRDVRGEQSALVTWATPPPHGRGYFVRNGCVGWTLVESRNVMASVASGTPKHDKSIACTPRQPRHASSRKM